MCAARPLLASLLALLLSLPLLAHGNPAHAAEDAVEKQIAVLEDRKRVRDAFKQRDRERAIAALGKIGNVEAAQALLPLFEDPFVHLQDRVVSAWITMMKGREAAEIQTWLTQRGMSHRDPRVRRAVAVVLGLTSGAEIEEPLRVAIGKEKEGAVLAALADAARRLRGEPALDGVLIKRLGHKDGRAVLALAEAAAQIDGKGAVPVLLKTLKHRDPLARAGAVLALQQLDALPPDRVDAIVGDKHPAPAMALADSLALRTQALPWPEKGKPVLERLLAAPSWRVRVAAIQGALRIWSNEIVDCLIARLEREPGRLRDDVQRALETYTGRDIGDDPDLWRGWWIRNHATFDPGARPEADRAGNVPFRSAGAADASDGSKTVAFFQMPLRSKRLAFVFDPSGSMRDAATDDASAGTKWELVHAELRKTLEALPPDTEFDIYVYRYPSKPYPPKPALTRALGKRLKATAGNVKKALRWLADERQAPKGWGAFYEPLAHVLEEDVDTVVLLSDGRPSRGIYDRDFRILQEFPRANRFRRTAVNTVLVGTKGADRKFMQALALATGGRFQETGTK